MKNIGLIVFFILSWMISLFAQNTLKVEKVERLNLPEKSEFFFPKLTPDGARVLFTGPKFVGLFMFDLKSAQMETLNMDIGAGYEYQISGDGQFVVYRPFEFKKGRKFYEIKIQNLSDKSVTVLEKEKRELSPPRIVNAKVIYLNDNQPVARAVTPHLSQSQPQNEKAVFIQNRTIVLVEGSTRKELKPLGEGIYLWPRLSPDGTRLLFTYAGDGTYISDLSGAILTRIGYANAPTWSPDGKWIAYMVDHDDGHQFTDSEIFIASADGKQKIQVTATDDVIEMYPNWDGVMTKLVFSSLKGQIFMATLKQE
ncbi:hypothetical protein Calab_1569 [Caldithrix abyssi DSM 13497]|uniref:WD40-like Beta Propeller Repeat n=1 Tax=Caldithrix abyssi DSM 13497 TaxID=880073 RepID=H1XR38_CALAY|nr:PD40 domain-containing protein [Caldithrix abyssi]APF17038.1 WD40-like Beta Propeller Repeat [Caldithrix abyssi DSM 13497]EHO41189.1 hypothetical protein Calab_1569 [Caldithrix abyssi DSM 13497]